MDDSDYGDPTGKERIVNIVRKSLEKTSSKGTFDDRNPIGKLLDAMQSCQGFRCKAYSEIWIYAMVPQDG
jgi:hypothetical protein